MQRRRYDVACPKAHGDLDTGLDCVSEHNVLAEANSLLGTDSAAGLDRIPAGDSHADTVCRADRTTAALGIEFPVL